MPGHKDLATMIQSRGQSSSFNSARLQSESKTPTHHDSSRNAVSSPPTFFKFSALEREKPFGVTDPLLLRKEWFSQGFAEAYR